MKPESIECAIKLIAMLHTSQEVIDDLQSDGAIFRHALKKSGKAFVQDLEKFIKEFYKNMDPIAEAEYHKHVNAFEELIKAYFDNNVEVKPDTHKPFISREEGSKLRRSITG